MNEDDWKNLANPECDLCHGLGYHTVCAYCHDNEPHSYCDDSWTRPCQCVKLKLKEKR